MRRVLVLLSLAAMVILGGMVGSMPPRAIAQEATPASEEMGFEGVTFEPVIIVPGVPAPALTAVVLVRVRLEPGAVFPSTPEDPDDVVLLVEEGTLALMLETPLSISRAGSFLEAIATAEAGGEFAAAGEAVASGEEVILEPGDALFVPARVPGELRNDSEEPASILLIVLADAAAGMPEATPAA